MDIASWQETVGSKLVVSGEDDSDPKGLSLASVLRVRVHKGGHGTERTEM